MKGVLLPTAFALALVSCKTKTTLMQHTQQVAVVDTSRVLVDSVTAVRTVRDSAVRVVQSERVAVVEFVEGGGIVVSDTDGRLRLEGVARVAQVQREAQGSKHSREMVEQYDSVRKQEDTSVRVDAVQATTKHETRLGGLLGLWGQGGAWLLLAFICALIIWRFGRFKA